MMTDEIPTCLSLKVRYTVLVQIQYEILKYQIDPSMLIKVLLYILHCLWRVHVGKGGGGETG